MPALIVERTSGGKTRVCNSRCYDAKSAVCVCCCGGRNHGVGFGKAVENTRATVGDLLSKPHTHTGIKLPFEEVQSA